MRSVAEQRFDGGGCILLSYVVMLCVSKCTDVDLNAGQAKQAAVGALVSSP